MIWGEKELVEIGCLQHKGNLLILSGSGKINNSSLSLYEIKINPKYEKKGFKDKVKLDKIPT